MKDFHIHSSFSFDSSTCIAKYVDFAKNFGYNYLCFTEHDMILESNEILNNYLQNAKKYNLSKQINVLFGIEIEINKISSLNLQTYNELDFILASFHQNCKTPIDYYINFYKLISESKDLAKIDSIAHIDFPLRYSAFAESFFDNFEQNSFFYLEKILDIMIKNNISLEVNIENLLSSNFETSFKFWRKLIEIYRRKNGFLFTFGSDSHSLDDFILATNKRKIVLEELNLVEKDFVAYKKHKIV